MRNILGSISTIKNFMGNAGRNTCNEYLYNALLDAIESMEKVIERLQTELTLADEEKKRCIKENSLQFDTVKGYAQGIAVAIEIVKSGIGSKDEK